MIGPDYAAFCYFGSMGMKKHFYIYGAGVYGKQCLEKLLDLGFTVKAFIVSELNTNPTELFGSSCNRKLMPIESEV